MDAPHLQQDLLVTDVRRVRVELPATAPGRPVDDAPVDVRITRGVVTEVGRGLSRDGVEVLDGGGLWAAPGLWDQHVHFAQWAMLGQRLDVSGTRSPQEVCERVRAHVATLPEWSETVVQGYGYRSATWAEPPTVEMLDEAAQGRPVVLISGDAHNGWLSSRALEMVGLGWRYGALDENEWFPVFSSLNDLPGARQLAEGGFRPALEAAAALGVVGIVDLELADGYFEWPGRFAGGLDTMRVRAGIYREGVDAVIAAGLTSGTALEHGDGLLEMGPFKIITDGSLNTRTAFCCQPFTDAPEGSDFRGALNLPGPQLEHHVRRGVEAGLEVSLHAIGDAAVEIVLDSFEASGGSGSVEHAQLIRREDIARLARLGIRASVQPAHLLDDRDVSEHCWSDRMDRCFMIGSMLRAGVDVRLGSDAPVSPLDPWLAMSAAVHRSADERDPWQPDEALTPAEAYACSTDGQTTLDVGSRGDLLLLEQDPTVSSGDSAEDGARLLATRPVATVLAGRVVHDA